MTPAEIIRSVSRECRNSDLRADNPEIRSRLASAWDTMTGVVADLQTEIEHLKERLRKAEDLNVYFRDTVGECHLMISRDTPEYQVRAEWDPTDLPPRLQKVMQERADLKASLPNAR